jgi:DNA-binding CsgD family transcriptional regulator
MPVMGDPLDEHHDLTPSERRVLALVARGKADAEIEAELGLTEVAVHSCLRRFRERTGLGGRHLTAWAVKHEPCCIAKSA